MDLPNFFGQKKLYFERMQKFGPLRRSPVPKVSAFVVRERAILKGARIPSYLNMGTIVPRGMKK